VSNASESGRTGNSVPAQGQSGSFTPAASRVPGPSKPAPTYQPQPTKPSSSSTPRQNVLAPKYGVLRGIASFCSIVAGAALVIGGLGFFVGVIMLALDDLRLIGILLMVGSVLFAVTGYIIFKIYAEGIYVLLDIEMNTRQTAVYSRQIANMPKQ
jgi:hypothetical protein